VSALASGILAILEPGAIDQIMTEEIDSMKITPEFLRVRNLNVDSIGDGFPVPDPKECYKSLDKHHREHSLDWTWPH